MKKSAKVAIIILSIVAVILTIIYILLSAVNKTIPQELIYPQSGLSQSIFESQNMKYTPTSGFNAVHMYEHSPYQFDIAECDSAKIGSGGTVYKLTDSMYVYTTEYDKELATEDIIKAELSKAIMIDSDDTMTVLDNYVYAQGYINGFKADYHIDCLTVSNGNRTASAYLTGYTLTITDEDYDHGYKMFLGIVTATKDTETFQTAKDLLDTLMATYQFNEELEESIVREEIAAEKDAERAEREAQEDALDQAAKEEKWDETVVSTDGSSSDMASQSTTTVAPTNSTTSTPGTTTEPTEDESVIPKYKEMTVTMEQDYTNVSLYYYYTNTAEDVQVVLYNPDKTKEYKPISNTDGTILFQLEEVKAGKWIVGISGDYGTCTMQMYSDQTNN